MNYETALLLLSLLRIPYYSNFCRIYNNRTKWGLPVNGREGRYCNRGIRDHYIRLCYQYNWLVPMVLCTNQSYHIILNNDPPIPLSQHHPALPFIKKSSTYYFRVIISMYLLTRRGRSRLYILHSTVQI